MPSRILGIRISKTGLAALVIGLLAFAAMLTGELVRHRQLRALDALLATVVDHDGRALGPADEGRRMRVAGLVTAAGPVRDSDTGLVVEAHALRRRVERWLVLDLTAIRPDDVRVIGWREVWFPDRNAQRFLPSLAMTTLLAPGLRIGTLPLGREVAERLNFGLGAPLGEDAVGALAAHFPQRHVARDGDGILIAAAEERRADDLRITYRAHRVAAPVTVIGIVRGGELQAPGPEFATLYHGERPAREMLEWRYADAPDEARFVGRIMGFLVLGGGLTGLVFWSAAAAARAEGRSDPNEGFVNVVGSSEVLSAIVGVPFLIASAPVGLALMIAAWAVTQGGLAMAGGIAAVLAMMLLTLWTTDDQY